MPGEVTHLLSAIESGDPKATEELLPLVYAELRRLAAARMAREQPGHTLQPTALVHEAWLRLGGDEQPRWETRAHRQAMVGLRPGVVDGRAAFGRVTLSRAQPI